jgi:hypothetical protein
MMAANSSSQERFAAALLDPTYPVPEGLTAWNGSDPAGRFAVYRNNVLSSLVNALAAKFPAVNELVGETFFRAMASVYARQSPPSSRRLAEFGDDFPDFLAGFEPARGLPYLPDVARLEILRLAAYHAADAEPMPPEAFQALLGHDLAECSFRFLPSAFVLKSQFAIYSLFAAHQGEIPINSVDPLTAESILIARPSDTVLVSLLEPGESAFVAALRAGSPIGQAVEAAMASVASFDLAGALVRLIGRNIVASINFSESSMS